MLNGDSENDDVAVELVRSLTEIAPVYYSLGDHEYYYVEAGNDDLQKNLEEAGAIELNYSKRQILMRLDIKLPQLFLSWSNSL